MSLATGLAVGLLLGLAAVVGWGCALGVTVAPRDLDRLHFLSPLTAIAVPAVGAAIAVHESPISIAGAKVLVIFVVLLISGPITAHALARAERIRTAGDWRPSAEERDVGTRERSRAEGGHR
ncbi:MAG: monovalent cation/H(+) antiporter subunit G [Candidatus Dormibacteraeota bacterium]|nr:monovalent cation/H(+) antiporter subunit G [Candidatus Dormibacteraeota bacterium]MBO0744233.1 monovalent cation/H(+) antiporter subunit G [Candidatus Dormibacteraeota bacterium]